MTGPVAADRLGMTLMHEHVLVDFIGAAEVSPSRYDADAVFKAVLPHLHQARRLGCETLVECTPAYLGRDPQLLKRLSEASGVHILSNTGYYGAAKDKHLPAHAFDETAEQLAARWMRECERGIDDTGDQAGVHEDRRRRKPAVGDRRQAGARRGAHASRDRPADRLAHRHRRRGAGRARPARGCRRAAVRVHLGARARRARREPSTRAPRDAAPGWSSTASARRLSRGTSSSCGA